jgi:hypothetical protein
LSIGNRFVPKVKGPREDTVEEALVRRVRAAGGRCEKLSLKGRRGFFDRLVVLPGRVVFVECKRPLGGVLSPHQIQLHATYQALGMEVAIVRSTADIDRLMR